MPSARLSTSARHQSSYGTVTTRPPRRSIAATFVGEAPSGTTTVAGIPSSLAAHATPCAMLPMLAVTTPRASSSGAACLIAL
jgi:hypothetical protein